MSKTIISSAVFFIIMSIVCGVLYPLIITGAAAILWPEKRRGSLIIKNEIVCGSTLLAQKFTLPEYFWPRPSASNYQALPALASNLGPTSEKQFSQLSKRREKLVRESGHFPQEIPDMLVTSSASGLDPHISEEALFFQLPRIVAVRALSAEQQNMLKTMIQNELAKSKSWLHAKAYANVLLLNIALDEAFGKMLR